MVRNAYLITNGLDIQTEHIHVFGRSLRLVQAIVRVKGRKTGDDVLAMARKKVVSLHEEASSPGKGLGTCLITDSLDLQTSRIHVSASSNGQFKPSFWLVLDVAAEVWSIQGKVAIMLILRLNIEDDLFSRGPYFKAPFATSVLSSCCLGPGN